jgi:hypothetical protein
MHTQNLIFAYLAIWAVILGRLAFDEWQQRRSKWTSDVSRN